MVIMIRSQFKITSPRSQIVWRSGWWYETGCHPHLRRVEWL